MIFATVPLAEARGTVLAHGLMLAGRRVGKGTPVTDALVTAARADGIAALTVARLEPGDIPEDKAASRLGMALAGAGTRAADPLHGRVNLHARHAGLLAFDTAAVHAVNNVDEALTLGTLPPFVPVAADQVVATIKVIPFAVAGAALAAAVTAAQPLRVLPWAGGLGTLIQTQLPGTSPKLLAKTSEVTEARLRALGMEFAHAPSVPHDVVALAEALRATGDARLLLVAGASATSDRNDVIPSAIVAAGGEVLRVGMPCDPGNLLCLGRLDGVPVLGLPGCARSPKRNGLDLVLERLAAGLEVDSAAIATMGVGGLLDEGARAVPWGWSTP